MMFYHPSLPNQCNLGSRCQAQAHSISLKNPKASCAHHESPNRNLSTLPTPAQTPQSHSATPTQPSRGPPPAMTPSLPEPSANCPFCTISTTYPPSAPQSPNLSSERTSPPTFLVLRSSPVCIAFLDIMPLSPGHLLLTTRTHREKVSEVTDEEARELGRWLRVLSGALARVTRVWDWNIVQNNGEWLPTPGSGLRGRGGRGEDGRARAREENV